MMQITTPPFSVVMGGDVLRNEEPRRMELRLLTSIWKLARFLPVAKASTLAT